MRPLFLEFGEPVLLDQNHGRGQQRAQPDYPLQPEKRRRVELGHAKPAQYGVGEHPQHDKEQNEAKKTRLPDKTTDAFEDPLRAADLSLFTRVELQNGLDILTGLVAFGFGWRISGIRRRRRRNGRFGVHQDMLLGLAGAEAGTNPATIDWLVCQRAQTSVGKTLMVHTRLGRGAGFIRLWRSQSSAAGPTSAVSPPGIRDAH